MLKITELGVVMKVLLILMTQCIVAKRPSSSINKLRLVNLTYAHVRVVVITTVATR